MSVRVAVRVRPFNQREKDLRSKCIVSMNEQTTILQGGDEPRPFTFDHSYWSHNPSDPHFATQEHVYETLGREVLDNAVGGYNTCVFAYGQTGAGKSYTMMGSDSGEHRGLIPRLCENLFRYTEERAAEETKWKGKIEVSYMEIYLEKVRDLLNSSGKGKLKVREHKSTGPYVENLTSHAVKDFDMVKQLMDDGNKMRTVRATKMNDVSSRSHAIFQIKFTQTSMVMKKGKNFKMERVSKLSLVDLAGSERSGQINDRKSDRMKEGNVINKSLSTLGKVINALAEKEKTSKKSKKSHIPYRESVLTWLLKESLGGNSKTVMMAAISPAHPNFDETLSTLRYANQAKNIVNKAIVNEDATAVMVRQLNEEIEALRQQLENAQKSSSGLRENAGGDIHDEEWEAEVALQLAESERLMEELTRSWEEKLENTLEMQAVRMCELRAHGILLADDDEDSTPVGVMAPRSTPYLINLHHNPMYDQQCLVYYLKEGTTIVGRKSNSCESLLEDEAIARVILLNGRDILKEHCLFHCFQDEDELINVVSIVPDHDAEITINSHRIYGETRLRSGDIIRLSRENSFRFDNPEEFGLSQYSSEDSPPRSERSVSSRPPSIPASPASVRKRVGGGSTPAQVLEERLPPIGAEDDEQAARLRAEAKAQAVFPFEIGDEDALLSALISNINPHAVSFKLLPAYGVYLITRYCQQEYDDKALNALMLKIATLLKMALYTSRTGKDVASLAFWLANSSELLMALRSDDTLASCQAAEAQLLLTDAIEEALSTLRADVQERITPGFVALLTENTMLSETLRGKRKGSQDKKVDVAYVVDSLKAVLHLLRNAMVTDSIVDQFFSQLYYYVGASVFNLFIRSKEYFRWDTGLTLRFNLTRLTEWSKDHGLNIDVEKHLQHIIQASMLLQANKSSLSHLDFICESCDRLNSKQIDRILRGYRKSSDEVNVPVPLIDCIKARAMNHADKLDEDDDSVACKVILERNESFVLPFRLSGNFHMNLGLLDKNLLDHVKDFLKEVDLTFEATPDQSFIQRPAATPTRLKDLDASSWASLEDFKSPPPAAKLDVSVAAPRKGFSAFFGF